MPWFVHRGRKQGKISTDGTFKERGSGLGLILCKEFVEKNQGIINVNSKPNEGTVFKILLPSFSQKKNIPKFNPINKTDI